MKGPPRATPAPGQFWKPRRTPSAGPRGGAHSIEVLEVRPGEVVIQRYDDVGEPLGNPRTIRKTSLRDDYRYLGTNVTNTVAAAKAADEGPDWRPR